MDQNNREQERRMVGGDIAERLLEFAARAMRVVMTLPANVVGKHVGRQLTKSGTSGGATYEEARGAESRADFVHKVSIAAKEVRESVYWCRLIHRAQLSRSADVLPLVREHITDVIEQQVPTRPIHRRNNRGCETLVADDHATMNARILAIPHLRRAIRWRRLASAEHAHAKNHREDDE